MFTNRNAQELEDQAQEAIRLLLGGEIDNGYECIISSLSSNQSLYYKNSHLFYFNVSIRIKTDSINELHTYLQRGVVLELEEQGQIHTFIPRDFIFTEVNLGSNVYEYSYRNALFKDDRLVDLDLIFLSEYSYMQMRRICEITNVMNCQVTSRIRLRGNL